MNDLLFIGISLSISAFSTASALHSYAVMKDSLKARRLELEFFKRQRDFFNENSRETFTEHLYTDEDLIFYKGFGNE